MPSSKFHFQEIDWVIYFPQVGNEGRPYFKYGVAFRDRKRNEPQPGVRINLEDVLEEPEIKEKYPHTIGYYLYSSGRGKNWTPNYLETLKISDVDEFFQFLKKLNI